MTGVVNAAELNALDAKTTLRINARGISTLSGLMADINTVVAASTTIQMDGDYGVTIDASANVAAADLNLLDALTSGLIDARAVSSLTGAIAQLNAATDNQGTIDTAEDVALTITSSNGVASDIVRLAGRTTGPVSIGSVVMVTGTAAGAVEVFTLANITDDQKQAVTLSDTTLAAASLNALDLLTTGVIQAGSVTTLTGAVIDVRKSYDANTAGSISGLGNEAVTLSDTTLVTHREHTP